PEAVDDKCSTLDLRIVGTRADGEYKPIKTDKMDSEYRHPDRGFHHRRRGTGFQSLRGAGLGKEQRSQSPGTHQAIYPQHLSDFLRWERGRTTPQSRKCGRWHRAILDG